MEEVIQFFIKYKAVFVIMHVFSVISGMGSALVSDVLFNIYIKDKKINITENHTLEILSKIIWVSLIGVVISGLAIFFSDTAKYMASHKFILKMLIVGIIIINGLLFAFITHGSLRKINFRDTNIQYKYVRIRKLSFAFGSISIISWFCAFILGSIRSIPVSLSQGIQIYFLLIFFGIIFSQILDILITKRK